MNISEQVAKMEAENISLKEELEMLKERMEREITGGDDALWEVSKLKEQVREWKEAWYTTHTESKAKIEKLKHTIAMGSNGYNV
jgi:regulator of replication initiation timing